MKLQQLLNQEQGVNRWIVSYADFITMLLALFMVMYALSQMDISNLEKFSQSVSKEFDVEVEPSNVQNYISSGQQKFLLNIFNTTETSVTFNEVNVSSQKEELQGLKKQLGNIENIVNKEAIEFDNVKKLLELKLAKTEGISVSRETRGLLVRLNDKILFDSGSAIIKENSYAVLDKLAEVLKTTTNPIKIEGHTDNIPINTDLYPSNWELSTARAISIIKYLINEHNIAPKKLSAVGYGEYMPIKDNITNENRAANRRVDIVILSSASKIFNPQKQENNK